MPLPHSAIMIAVPFPFQLAFDRLRHGELGVIQGIARPLLDAVVDGQHLLRQRLGCRVKEGEKLIPDAVCHGDAEGVEIAGDVFHLLKAVRGPGYGSRYGDLSAFQSVL